MGRPSSKRRSAQRPGKRERARVKKPRRGESFSNVPSAGTCTLKAGRKKWKEFHRSRRNPFGAKYSADLCYQATVHLSGEPISKAGTLSQDG
jgi:hypothetical protein